MAKPELKIDGAACVRSRLLRAICTACQDTCPVYAIDLTMRVPVVDQMACTLCGVCAVVCPETVFSPPTPIPPARGEKHFIACHCHPLVMDTASLRCIHSIGLGDLAQMWLNGMRRLVVSVGDCVFCSASPKVAIDTTIADFNRLAQCRDLDGIELVCATDSEVRKWQKTNAQPDASRRAFLRRFVAPAPLETDAPAPDALQQFLALGDQGIPADVLYPFSPHIDATTCIGCDDCVNICPNGSLTLIKADNDQSFYHPIPESCTGCGLCKDICEASAVEVFGMQSKGADMPLDRFQCRSCGVQGHTTHANPPKDGLCRICQRTDHHKKLFVVLD